MTGRWTWRVLTWLCAAGLLPGCRETLAPTREPPYIAIVAIFTSSDGTDLGRQYTYHVTEISGTTGIDESIKAAPHDTIIVPVVPATYRVTVDGVPSYCRFPGNGSSEYYILVPEGANTALVRYQISCESRLTLTTATDGVDPDQAFIYHITGRDVDRTGIIGSTDTLRFDDLVAGDYVVRLGHVAANCVVTSARGPSAGVSVATEGGARADFRISCADEAKRPHLLSFASSYHDGTSGFIFRAVDPDGDIERYNWDVTDCQGQSVFPEGGRQRRGLLQGRAVLADTITVFGAIEVELPDNPANAMRCTSIRIEDQYGNSTPVFEEPIGNEQGSGPVATIFNALLLNTSQLQTQLAVGSPGYLGVFAAARLRDGILGPPDGKPDLGIFSAGGFEGTVLPTVPLGHGRPEYYDYYSVIIYLFDDRGNFTRLEDPDLFH